MSVDQIIVNGLSYRDVRQKFLIVNEKIIFPIGPSECDIKISDHNSDENAHNDRFSQVVSIAGNETITGEKTFSSAIIRNGVLAQNITAGGELSLYSGSDQISGGALLLFDKDSVYPGHFFLRAGDGEENSDLEGDPSGVLRWNNLGVLTESNGVVFPNYNLIYGLATGYITTSNGWILWVGENGTHYLNIDSNALVLGRDGNRTYIVIPVKSGSVIDFVANFCGFIPMKNVY